MSRGRLVLEQRLSFVGLYPLNGERERSKNGGKKERREEKWRETERGRGE